MSAIDIKVAIIALLLVQGCGGRASPNADCHRESPAGGADYGNAAAGDNNASGRAGAGGAGASGAASGAITSAGAEPGGAASGGMGSITSPPASAGFGDLTQVRQDDCVVTRVPGEMSSFPTSYLLIRYAASLRIRTRRYSNVRDFSDVTLTRVDQYDAGGHVTAAAEQGFPADAYSSWRRDFQFDDHGNEIYTAVTFTDNLDVTAAPAPPQAWTLVSAHTYDPLGRLIATQKASSSTWYDTYSYAVDALGRCANVVWYESSGYKCSYAVAYSYANNKLSRIEQTRTCDPFGVVEHLTAELKLDELGRRQSIDVQSTGASGIFSDPLPYFRIPRRSYSYEMDGSVTISYPDLMSDTPSQDAPARYLIAPKCLDIASELINIEGNDCRYPLADWSDPLIW